MPLHLERIEWMPSPPLAPGDGPIDFDHLQRMTLGDAAIEQEVLTMFLAQSATLVHTLAAIPADANALAHTLKGSARAIGGHRQRPRCVRCARRAWRGGCRGAGSDRGGSAPFLSGKAVRIGQNGGKVRP
jgi:hypothetical protein